MITATAKSTTLPRMMNVLNSLSILFGFKLSYVVLYSWR
jgi:hypothetical protein